MLEGLYGYYKSIINAELSIVQYSDNMCTTLLGLESATFLPLSPLRLKGIVVAWEGSRRRPEPCEHDNSL